MGKLGRQPYDAQGAGHVDSAEADHANVPPEHVEQSPEGVEAQQVDQNVELETQARKEEQGNPEIREEVGHPVGKEDSTDEGIQIFDEPLDDPQEQEQEESEQVEDTTVVFVPFKDFGARVNQTEFNFRKDVPTRISRDLANQLLDGERGYVR